MPEKNKDTYKEEFNALYEQYKNKSEDELLEIINSGDSYRDSAKEVAKFILNGDRTNYKKRIAEFDKEAQQNQEKNELRKTNPLYDDIHQIAKDVRFFKNLVIFCIAIEIIAALILILLRI